ncbi:MAG: hypothetical protein AAF206_19990 [Bacteroidota bacterium]
MKQALSILFILLGLLVTETSAQKSYQAVLLNKAAGKFKGDTVDILGSRMHPFRGQQYLLRTIRGELLYQKTDKFKILNPDQDFWLNTWWAYRSATLLEDDSYASNRTLVWEKEKIWFDHFRGQSEQSTADMYVEDYLQQLINRIHPLSMEGYTGEKRYLSVFFLPTQDNLPRFFQSGEIVIPPLWLAEFSHEYELIEALSGIVASMVMEHKIANAKVSDGVLYHIRPFEHEQKQITKMVADSFLNQAGIERVASEEKAKALSKEIAPAILLAASHAEKAREYHHALSLLDRIIEAEAASEQAYLLKARILRRLYNTEMSNQEALGYLEQAASLSRQNNPDILIEQGLLYLRLAEYEKAKAAFSAYEAELDNRQSNKEQKKWVQEMLFHCARRSAQP